jgi:transposase
MRSYRIEIKPNKTQLRLIKQSCDVARFAYNWMLGKKIAERESLKSLAKMWDLDKVPSIHGSAIDWHKEWVIFKQEKNGLKKYLNVVDNSH